MDRQVVKQIGSPGLESCVVVRWFVILTFVPVDEILWCCHTNEISLALVLHI